MRALVSGRNTTPEGGVGRIATVGFVHADSVAAAVTSGSDGTAVPYPTIVSSKARSTDPVTGTAHAGRRNRVGAPTIPGEPQRAVSDPGTHHAKEPIAVGNEGAVTLAEPTKGLDGGNANVPLPIDDSYAAKTER